MTLGQNNGVGFSEMDGPTDGLCVVGLTVGLLVGNLMTKLIFPLGDLAGALVGESIAPSSLLL